MNHPLRVFGVSLEQANKIPPTDFGPLASLAAAVRNVSGVYDAEAIPAKDQRDCPLIMIRAHKHFNTSWEELGPRIQRAIDRCCSPLTRTSSSSTDDDEDTLAA